MCRRHARSFDDLAMNAATDDPEPCTGEDMVFNLYNTMPTPWLALPLTVRGRSLRSTKLVAQSCSPSVVALALRDLTFPGDPPAGEPRKSIRNLSERDGVRIDAEFTIRHVRHNGFHVCGGATQ